MKKKYGLFKVLMGLLLLVVVLTYFLKGRQGTITYLAIGDVFLNYLQSFYFFFETAIFILVVGGFYGLLNRIPAYKKLVNTIAEKVSSRSKLFIIIMTVMFALISSLTGLNGILLVFVPFIVSIILLLGYDKLVALSTTIGGILVGFIGGVFLTFKDAMNQYSSGSTTFDQLVGLDGLWTNIFPKILLLVVATGLLVFYIINHIKRVENKEVNYSLTKGDNLFVEVKDRTGKAVDVNDSEVKIWPLIVGLISLFVLLILGYLPWADLFKINVFNDFHTWLTAITFADWKYVFLGLFVIMLGFTIFKLVKKIKAHEFNRKFALTILFILVELGIISIFAGYGIGFIADTGYGKWVAELTLWKSSVFTSLISTSFRAFGTWGNLGSYMMAIVLVILFGVVFKFIYRVDFEDAMDGFIYGVKKMIPATMIAMFAYCVLVCSYNNGFIETLILNVSESFGDNVLIHSLITIFGSLLNVDLYYTSAAVFSTIISNLTESANLAVYALMFQSLFGFVQLVGPTSLLLIIGLSYLDVPYKSWLKYIWRFLVQLLIIILIVLMIVTLL